MSTADIPDLFSHPAAAALRHLDFSVFSFLSFSFLLSWLSFSKSRITAKMKVRSLTCKFILLSVLSDEIWQQSQIKSQKANFN